MASFQTKKQYRKELTKISFFVDSSPEIIGSTRVSSYIIFSMRQILCVIDFSESSKKVLELAARFAVACKSHLTVLFPYRLIDHHHQGSLASLKQTLESEAREKFNTLRKTLPDESILSCEFQPEIGFISDRINAHVDRNKECIDMVIVGQEQTASSNDSKGFNLQNLLTNSRIPFVIVPTEVNAEASMG